MPQNLRLRSLAAASFQLASFASRWNGVLAARDGFCPPLGPVLPAPTRPNGASSVKDAAAALQETLKGMTSSLNKSAVSVSVRSIHESEMMFDFHYQPPELDPKGVQKVDSDSVYRLASASKVFPILALLMLDDVSLEDRIMKYVPELRDLKDQAPVQNAITVADWDDITLGAMASHLSGIAADLTTDLEEFDIPWQDWGLPPVDDKDKLGCSGILDGKPCSWTDLFNNFGKRPPIYAPFTTPIYSNIAVALLSLVVERTSNQTISDYIQEKILDYVGMKHTFLTKPEDSLGVIPVNESFWTADIGFESPTGNYYSSTKDMLALGTAILEYKLLPPSKTRRWLKPWTSTSSLGTLIGAPWEIYRVDNVTEDQRLIELYTKGGDIVTYHSSLALIPDYDLVMMVFVAGPEVSGGLAQQAQGEAVKALLPALEQAGKDEARPAYSGVYVDEATNSSLRLSLDGAEGPGLAVTDWFVRGVDVIASLPSVNIVPVPPSPPGTVVRVRLYPTNLETGDQIAWRTSVDTTDGQTTDEEDAKFPWPQGSCNAWAAGDRLVWNFQAIDYFVFDIENKDDGVYAVGLNLPAYRVKLQREASGYGSA